MNMNVVEGFRSSEIARWFEKHIVSGSVVVSDGLACFSAVTESGCQHVSIVTGGGPSCVTMEEFTWVNTMIKENGCPLSPYCLLSTVSYTVSVDVHLFRNVSSDSNL